MKSGFEKTLIDISQIAVRPLNVILMMSEVLNDSLVILKDARWINITFNEIQRTFKRSKEYNARLKGPLEGIHIQSTLEVHYAF